jgi:hypothetical protein
VKNGTYSTTYELEMVIPKEMAVTAFTVFNLGGYSCSGRIAWALSRSLRQSGPMVEVEVTYSTSGYSSYLMNRIDDRPAYLSPKQEAQMDDFADLIESL